MEPTESTPGRVLILTPIGRDAAASADLLHRVGMSSVICKDLAELVDSLETDVIAVLVAEEALFGKDIAALKAWVARQPAWSDLPFVVLTSKVAHSRVAEWRQQLVASLRTASLLERPVQTITLTSAMQSAARA